MTEQSKYQELREVLQTNNEEPIYIKGTAEEDILFAKKVFLILLDESEGGTQPVFCHLFLNEIGEERMKGFHKAAKSINHNKHPAKILQKSIMPDFHFSYLGALRSKKEYGTDPSDENNPSFLCCFSRKHFSRNEQDVKEVLVTKSKIEEYGFAV